MKIRKTVKEKGNIVMEIEIDGEWKNSLNCYLSRELTETTHEHSRGIFNICPQHNKLVWFYYGEYKKEMEFNQELHYVDTIETFASILQERIDMVRSWVAECKSLACVETAEIITTEQVVAKLRDENKLLYRNDKGQIQTLNI